MGFQMVSAADSVWSSNMAGWIMPELSMEVGYHGKLINLPSGEHTKNYGTSPFLMGKSTINGHFPLQTVSSPEGK